MCAAFSTSCPRRTSCPKRLCRLRRFLPDDVGRRPHVRQTRGVRCRRLFLITLAAASLVSCRRAAPPSSAPLIERTHQTMGTELRVTAAAADRMRADAAIDAVFREFDRLDGMMSVWKDGSDIVRVNAAAGEHAVPVSPETREVLRIANQISEQRSEEHTSELQSRF